MNGGVGPLLSDLEKFDMTASIRIAQLSWRRIMRVIDYDIRFCFRCSCLRTLSFYSYNRVHIIRINSRRI